MFRQHWQLLHHFCTFESGKRQRRGFGGKDQQRIATTVKDWWNGDDDSIFNDEQDYGLTLTTKQRNKIWYQS